MQIKIRYSDISALNRQVTIEQPIDSAETIYQVGCWLLARENPVQRVHFR